VVLTFHHALRAHEALSRSDALPGFLEVVHSLFENGVFVSHERSIRVGILRSLRLFRLLPRAGRLGALEEEWTDEEAMSTPRPTGPGSSGAPAFLAE
jgi:hypothetical protein